jgi:hypothetical protein
LFWAFEAFDALELLEAFDALAASLPRCQADWAWALTDALSLLASAALLLLSSSEAKRSVHCAGPCADLAALGCGP